MSRIVDQVRLLSRFRSGDPAPEINIDAAEKQLGTTFAPDYRACAAAFGRITCFGHELTGIGSAKRLDVVEITKQRRSENQTVPDTWYVIEELHIDDVCAWQNPQGEIYLIHPGAKPRHAADTLLEYLKS